MIPRFKPPLAPFAQPCETPLACQPPTISPYLRSIPRPPSSRCAAGHRVLHRRRHHQVHFGCGEQRLGRVHQPERWQLATDAGGRPRLGLCARLQRGLRHQGLHAPGHPHLRGRCPPTTQTPPWPCPCPATHPAAKRPSIGSLPQATPGLAPRWAPGASPLPISPSRCDISATSPHDLPLERPFIFPSSPSDLPRPAPSATASCLALHHPRHRFRRLRRLRRRRRSPARRSSRTAAPAVL